MGSGKEYEELEEVPDEFRTFAARHALEYRNTLPGIALYLGGAALFTGGLLVTTPEDRRVGLWLILLGLVLLVAWIVLHRRKLRRERELHRRYLHWKRKQNEPGDPYE
ncbi:hypothetical protein AB0M79_17665 [Polymorphospora sp. NPDC051019]|uniref:hypothetical protein n=1 Tax=Polymorphospora sp. NPDC051019 TaxID=3155725 RepID=UPI0034277098